MSAADQLEQQYPGLLDATAHVESRGNPNAVSPKGARGMYQLMPATAAHYGVDPHDPAQAREAAAQNIQEGLKWSGGDLDKAMRYFQGGPNTKGWGKENAAYPGLVMAALQRKSGGQPAPQATPPADHDPYEQALSDSPSKSAPPHSVSSDPFEAALQGGKSGDNATPSVNAPVDTGNQGGGGGGVVPQVYPVGRNGPAGSGVQAGSDGGYAGGPGGQPSQPGQDLRGTQSPEAPQEDLVANVGEGTHDALVGALRGFGSMAGTGATLLGKGFDATGLTQGAGDRALKNSDDLQSLLASRQYAPHGWGNLGGNIASALPLVELKALQAAPEAGALIKALSYGAQGGLAGGALSGGHDMLWNTAVGAGTGAVVGPIGEKIVAPILAPVLSKAKTLAKTLREASGGGGATGADADAAFQASMARGGPKVSRPSNEDLARALDAQDPNFGKFDPATGATDMGNIVGGQDAPDPLDLAKGLKAAGARNGIEATTTLPAKAAEDAAALKASGVPDDHALNEASIRYVGGNPTVGSVTRERAAMQAEKEGAKISSEEGAALASRAAENNAALHDTVQETVNGYGGVPAQGEASQAVAESLARASDTSKAKVSKLYETARATDGDAKLNTDGIRELLQSPELATPTSPQVKQLADGIRSHLDAVDARAGTTLRTPDEIEQLRQLANSAYDQMGGPVNGAIRKVGKSLDDSLDQLDTVSGAYKTARAAHRDWASQYADPEGIARITQRDAGGNLVNEDNWRRADNGLIGTTSDRAFTQVTRQLKVNGDTATLDRLKAEIVQRAYQRATNTAADESGNPVFSAKQWHTELNKIGMPKLKAIFSDDEIAHLATVGRAARALHESVPGTVNGSGTSAALINALRGMKTAKDINPVVGALARGAKLSGHILASHVPIIGNVAVEGLAGAAGKVSANRSSAATSKQLAKAIREAMDPAAARKAVNDNAAKALTQSQRKALAMALGKRGAGAAASSKGNR